MPFKLDILKRSEAEPYDIFFKSCPHGFIQQSVQWSDVIAPLSPDTPYFAVVSNEERAIIGGLPLYHFSTPYGGILTSVPHAGPLGGVLYRENEDSHTKQRIYATLMDGAISLAKELRCISLTVITNPFLQNTNYYMNTAPPDYVFNNFCQVIDLPHLFSSSKTYFSDKSGHTVDRNVRRNLKKAAENNVIVEWGIEDDFEVWYQIHAKRHTELGAAPLPKPLLKNILNILSSLNMSGLVIAKMANKIIGGCIFIWNKEVADAFILSSDSQYMDYGINHAITDFAVRYFHDRGMRWFNWQGCKRDSGVYRFKQSWGSEERSYEFLTWTFDGFKKIFSYSFEDITRAYQWHYLAPFEAIKSKLLNGNYNK